MTAHACIAEETYGGCLERALAARYGGSASTGHPLPPQNREGAVVMDPSAAALAAPATALETAPEGHDVRPDVEAPKGTLVTETMPLPASGKAPDPDAPADGR